MKAKTRLMPGQVLRRQGAWAWLISAVTLFGCAFLVGSCATYQGTVQAPRDLLKQGKFAEALPLFQKLAEKPGDDQLVYLMEYGTALQMAGQYKESNEVFLKADKLTELNDYHSVSNIAMATLGSEEMIQYKGESYEKLLINASLALNYTMLGQTDDALVEARRINEKIQKFRQDGRPDYEQNPFADYLSGLLWDSDHRYDDAYISFEEAYKLDGRNPYLPEDLIRMAKLARRDDAYQKWKKDFPQIRENSDWYNKNKAQVVVIIEQGWGPRKGFLPNNRRFPHLYPVPSRTQAVRAELVEGTANGASPPMVLETERSKPVYDVENVAIKTLAADYGWMQARKLGAFAAKAVVADQIRQKNELLGLVAMIGMSAADRADLRQWSTLPQTIQVARFWIDPGTYHLNLTGMDYGHVATGDYVENIPVDARAGHTKFFFWRPYR